MKTSRLAAVPKGRVSWIKRPLGTAAKRCGTLVVAALCAGCIRRTLSVDCNVPGALVYLNDHEIGRTPFTVPITWYGGYDVLIRADGYKTLKTSAEVTAPWWQWVPFDLLTDFLPLRDDERLDFKLEPQPPVDPQQVLKEGEAMREELESSEHTVRKNVLDVRPPTTKPTTSPATGPTTQTTRSATAPSTGPTTSGTTNPAG